MKVLIDSSAATGPIFFVIDLSLIGEADEFVDFDPDEGDSILLKLLPKSGKEKNLSTDISGGKIKVEYDRYTLDNVSPELCR